MAEHLAITSVPIQQWGAVYEDKKALKIGTIFEELNKPFFVTEHQDCTPCSNSLNEREKLMQHIDEVSFVINDLTLYLDMHCQDKQAAELFREKMAERKELLKEFAKQFYPLTPECTEYAEAEASWNKGPMPWEGACI